MFLHLSSRSRAYQACVGWVNSFLPMILLSIGRQHIRNRMPTVSNHWKRSARDFPMLGKTGGVRFQ